MRYQNIGSKFFFLSQSTCVTEGQNYDPQDCASVAALRDKNHQYTEGAERMGTPSSAN